MAFDLIQYSNYTLQLRSIHQQCQPRYTILLLSTHTILSKSVQLPSWTASLHRRVQILFLSEFKYRLSEILLPVEVVCVATWAQYSIQYRRMEPPRQWDNTGPTNKSSAEHYSSCNYRKYSKLREKFVWILTLKYKGWIQSSGNTAVTWRMCVGWHYRRLYLIAEVQLK